MNKRLVFLNIGKILTVEAGFMILPLLVSLIYQEGLKNFLSFLTVIIILLIVGYFLTKIKTDQMKLGVKDGFGIVALSWVFLSFFGGLPFVFSGQIKSLVDAFFETSSGFTTTGASILEDVEALSHSMLFWRSFTHLIGGMGILVFVLAIFPKFGKGAVHVMKSEVPGPSFGKLVSKIDISAKILYKIYIFMTLALIFILILFGMKPFDACIHAFGAAGTGGFSNKALSVGYYDNWKIDYTLAIAMFIFGINFNLYYMIIIGKVREAFSNEELKAYLSIAGIAILLICLNLKDTYSSILDLIRDVFFTVSSVMTTTGYATADFAKWPLFSHVVLLLLMFIGSCAGSTAGGIKVSRIMILVKSGIKEIRTALNPNRVITITENKKPLQDQVVINALRYMVLYGLVFIICLLVVSIDAKDYVSAFSSVAATLNNIGPGLGIVGPQGNYAGYSNLSKLVLSLAMIIGRLEILPVLVLLSPESWNKR